MAESINDWFANPQYQQARAQLQPVIQQTAQQYGVPPELLDYVAGVESRWGTVPGLDRPGTAQELGFLQQTPAFREQFGVQDPFDPAQALAGTAQALRSFYERSGDWGDTVIGYNRGAGGLQQYLSSGRDLSTQPRISADYRRNYDLFMDALRRATTNSESSLGQYSAPVQGALQRMNLNTMPQAAPAVSPLASAFTNDNPLEFAPRRTRPSFTVGNVDTILGRIDNA